MNNDNNRFNMPVTVISDTGVEEGTLHEDDSITVASGARPFRFIGPIAPTHGVYGGGNFQITFANGYTVSVADTSMSSDFQRIEVAVLKKGEFLTDSMIATPTSILTLMVETALRPTAKE